ncbi:MAG: DUF1579 domain-containing protein [Steroidobacteraceae bacterium]
MATGILIAVIVAIDTVDAQDRSSLPTQTAAGDLSGSHDFDFLIGEWRVHHRIKRPIDTGQWSEFDGTCSNRGLIDGAANVEEHRFDRPTGVTYGIAIRAYDPKAAEWAIWWIDSRVPHGAMDSPVKGRFENGVGTFYSDGTLDRKPIRVRFIWSEITPMSARWEQAYSSNAGKSWESNWIMEFRRENQTSRKS